MIGLTTKLIAAGTLPPRINAYLFEQFPGAALDPVPPDERVECANAILRELARIARAQGCGRMEWWCLDWNRPSIDFYLSLGAEPMSAWTVYRISGSTLTRLAQEDEE